MGFMDMYRLFVAELMEIPLEEMGDFKRGFLIRLQEEGFKQDIILCVERLLDMVKRDKEQKEYADLQ